MNIKLKFITYKLLILSILIFYGCKKELDEGFFISKEEDGILTNKVDTTSLLAYTVLNSKIKTNGLQTPVIGNYIDPIFGYTNAQFVTQFLSSSEYDFGEGTIIDSVIMQLSYSDYKTGYYGDKNIEQEIKIYDNTQDLKSDTSYYSDGNPTEYKGTNLIGSYKYKPFAADTSMLKLKLENSFGRELLDFKYKDDSGKEFLEKFKGLFIETDASVKNSALVKFDLLSTNSKIIIYYHNNENDEQQSYYYTFLNSVRFGLYQHDYTGTVFENDLGKYSKASEKLYIQGLGGIKSKILLPYIDNYSEKGAVAINKAELVIKAESTSDEIYTPIDYLKINSIDENGEEVYIDEFINNNSYVAVSYIDGEYKFNITKYIQSLVKNKKSNLGIYISAQNGSSNVKRSIITTMNHKTNPMKLVLSYTIID